MKNDLTNLLEKTKIFWAGPTSTWGLKKFLKTMQDPYIGSLFELSGVIGRKTVEEDAKSIKEKSEKDVSGLNFSKSILNGDIPHYKYETINGETQIPEVIFDTPLGSIYICSNNTRHLDQISYSARRGIHTLFEKPACVVLDEQGMAYDGQIKQLEALVETNPQVVIMDAEHYAYKALSQWFHKEFTKTLGNRKISHMNATIIEKDNADCQRNKNMFAIGERTGLMTDVGVHALSYITNQNAKVTPQKDNIFYGFYPGYETETFVRAKYDIFPERNSPFANDAIASIAIEKFTQKRKEPEKTRPFDSDKRITFTLTDKSQVELNFNDGTAYTISPSGNRTAITNTNKYSQNEYINSLKEFNDSIRTGNAPLTDIRNSLKTMHAIYDTYKVAPPSDKKNRRDVYE